MDSSMLEGLTCLIGNAEVLAPAEYVDRVTEFDVLPRPPLAQHWIGGLGLHAGQIVVVVRLSAASDAPESRSIRAVLMRRDDEFVWALEIDHARRFVKREVRTNEYADGAQWRCPRTFLCKAVNANATETNPPTFWLNAAAVRAALLGLDDTTDGDATEAAE